ncbi:MAG: DUF1826 domain-containing protein [Methylococcales bacterium]|nr:DUF1826 domain-containing protein [Methylococcales bacterium]
MTVLMDVPVDLIAVRTADPVDLAAIYEDGINVCILERRVLNHRLLTFVESVLARTETILETRVLSVQQFDFASLLPQLARLPGYQAFCDDLAWITHVFSDLFELDQVGLRLRTLDKPMCPKFHVDHVPCRLVTTYGGVGTEWLEDWAVDRTRLGVNSHGLDDVRFGVVKDPGAVQTMPAYAVGLLKGTRWEGNEQQGAVHRSPATAPDCSRRLLLTLDFAQ